MEKMYSAGIFFVSSILGLGVKTDGFLRNNQYRKIYRKEKESYCDSEDEDYTTLYRYNIMPAQIKEALVSKCEAHPNLIYANSGLYGIEQEMEDFASKYSAYNKCQMVYLFLTNVIDETNRRRAKQQAFNIEHGITPKSIKKAVHGIIEISGAVEDAAAGMNEDEKAEKIALLTEQMQRAAMELEFETAAKLRDELYRLQGRSDGASDSAPKPGTKRGAKPGTPGSRKKARGRTRK